MGTWYFFCAREKYAIKPCNQKDDMKFFIGIILSVCFIFNVAAMDTITVTKTVEDAKAVTRNILTQSNTTTKKYVMVCKIRDKATQKISYCGISGDLRWHEEEKHYVPILMANRSLFGDFNKPKNPAYKKLQALWQQLNEQVES